MFSNNSVESHGGVLVGGTSASVLVERNSVRNSEVGVLVNASVHEGIVLWRNDARLDLQAP
eukprot:COSAG04_NODE_2865_length_3462_cov_1.574487_1_plen_61_part_00